MLPRLTALLFAALSCLCLPGFAQQSSTGTAEANSPVAAAGRLRTEAQRLAKLHLQERLGTDAAAAQDQLNLGMRQADNALQVVARQSLSGSGARAQRRISELWPELLNLVSQPPTAESVNQVPLVAEEITLQAERLAVQLEGQETSPVWRLVGLAQRTDMLAQRLARTYLQVRLGDRAQGRKVDLEQTRKEFETSLKELEGAPESTSAIARQLATARRQWLFFEAAIGPDGADATAAQHVVTTSRRIGEQLGEIADSYARIAAGNRNPR